MTGNPEKPYDAANVGRRIRALREHMGISQATLAEKCGVTPGAVGLWEQGRQRPTIVQGSAIVDAASALDLPGVTLDYIFLGRAEMMPHGLAVTLSQIESRMLAKRSKGRPSS